MNDASPPPDQNEPRELRQVTILGVGLLGGSIAKSLARWESPPKLVGWARSPRTEDSLNKLAILDEVTQSMETACADADVIIVAIPVTAIQDCICEIAEITRGQQSLITDVGSTKARIVREAMKRIPDDMARFVPAHPIAGSEKSGAQFATAELFDGKLTILTPHKRSDSSFVRRGHQFWTAVGCRVVEMSPEDHDAHLAAVSHVPHLASALVAMGTPESALTLTGSGWRDITRVAAGDVEMWTAIVQENREAILGGLRNMAGDLNQLIDLIEQNRDKDLSQWLAQAKARKQQAIDKTSSRSDS